MEKYLIKTILLEQKEEIARIFKGKIIPREAESQMRRMLAEDLVKVITGVRRCGKSVLSHQLLRDKKYAYVNFDDERLIGVKTKDLNDFLEALNEITPDFKYIFLDEAQNVPGWELFVNRLRRNGYNIIVSGSNSQLLSKELATHLTGRHLRSDLFPFSFREFLLFKGVTVAKQDLYITEKRAKIKNLLEEYMHFGGFPEILHMEMKMEYLRELYDKIITRDIIARYNVKYVKDLKEIALFAISNFGSRISFHRIRNIFSMKSVHTVKNYLEFLQDAYLLFQINAFSYKLKEQFNRSKKIYCCDTGLINAIIPRSTADNGRLMENIVFLELKRQAKEIYFFERGAYEVDFLIRAGRDVARLIQVCYSLERENTEKREITSLLKASEELKCKNLSVITWNVCKEEKIGSRVIKFIPLWEWLM